MAEGQSHVSRSRVDAGVSADVQTGSFPGVENRSNCCLLIIPALTPVRFLGGTPILLDRLMPNKVAFPSASTLPTSAIVQQVRKSSVPARLGIKPDFVTAGGLSIECESEGPE